MSDVLRQLVDLSHELGREERHLAILGEGNTSAINEDGTFWVKGSGSSLSTIRAEQFSRVRVDVVLETMRGGGQTEAEVEAALTGALVDADQPRPSIETLMHALCLTGGGARFVGHTHAEACNAILCSRHGAEPFRRHIFPDGVVVCGRAPAVVPYVEPGVPLGLAVAEAIRRSIAESGKPPKLLLMVNHGIVALGQTAREVLNITLMAEKWARVLVNTLAIGGPTYLPQSSVDALDARLDEHYRRKQLSG
jgi:rhamnose utilization protein RhaD (predicted bifunctional aldolase and dehydrogenase)